MLITLIGGIFKARHLELFEARDIFHQGLARRCVVAADGMTGSDEAKRALLELVSGCVPQSIAPTGDGGYEIRAVIGGHDCRARSCSSADWLRGMDVNMIWIVGASSAEFRETALLAVRTRLGAPPSSL